MGQNPFLGSNQSLGLSWYLEVHYKVQKSLPENHFLGLLNPVNILAPYFFNTLWSRQLLEPPLELGTLSMLNPKAADFIQKAYNTRI